MNKKPPCFSCKVRKTGCHAECERYGKWSKARQEMQAEKWRLESGIKGYAVDQAVRNAKHARKKGTRNKNHNVQM